MARREHGPVGNLSRRRLLEAAAAALALGSGIVAAIHARRYDEVPGRKLKWLAVWQWTVVVHAARRIAASDESATTPAPTPDEVDVAGFVDGWMDRMDERAARDLGRFLAYLEHVAPLGRGLVSRFTRLSPPDQDGVLAAIQTSRSDLLRAGFEGLKALVFMGYYRDPRTWRVLGYDGPLVDRPAAGWP